MFADPSSPASMIFPLAAGLFLLGASIFTRPLWRLLRITPPSEVFTVPEFRRSAEINETLGRLTTAIMGLLFMLGAVGPSILPFHTMYTIGFTLLALLGMIILAMAGVTLANWKA